MLNFLRFLIITLFRYYDSRHMTDPIEPGLQCQQSEGGTMSCHVIVCQLRQVEIAVPYALNRVSDAVFVVYVHSDCGCSFA